MLEGGVFLVAVEGSECCTRAFGFAAGAAETGGKG